MMSTSKFYSPNTFWVVSLCFVLFQFFLLLSSGVVVSAMMKNLSLSALQAGVLSSAYYYIYTGLQIPVGTILDQKNTRNVLALNALICTLGCFLLASGHHFWSLMFSRLIMGAGSSFAFIGLSHVIRQHFPVNRFGFLMGISETLAFLVTVFVMLGMGGGLITSSNWREFMIYTGIVGIIVTLLCACFLPNECPEKTGTRVIWKSFVGLCKNKIAWINGLFVGFGFTVITVFGAMWAVPFIQLKIGCDLQTASLIDAMIFLGAGVSCPLFGHLEARAKKRRPVILLSYGSTLLLMLVTIFVPISSPFTLGFMMFLVGTCCGAYMLAYNIANEISTKESLSTSTGFANTLAMLTAPVMQPMVGYLLDKLSTAPGQYTLQNYQHALLLVPASLLAGIIFVMFLPEKS